MHTTHNPGTINYINMHVNTSRLLIPIGTKFRTEFHNSLLEARKLGKNKYKYFMSWYNATSKFHNHAKFQPYIDNPATILR